MAQGCNSYSSSNASVCTPVAVELEGPGVVAYPEWPLGLSDRAAACRAPLDAFGACATASAKSRRELVAASRAQRSGAAASTSKATPSAYSVLKTATSREPESLELPLRRCSSQVQCRRAVATKKCLSCVQFDDLQLGYYCDACFSARHPAYRLAHVWIPIEDDVTEEHERIYHLTRCKLEQDIRELEFLLAKTHDFLERPRRAPPHLAAPSTPGTALSTRVSVSRYSTPATRSRSRTPLLTTPPPPPPSSSSSSSPPKIQRSKLRTATGEIDFHATYSTMAAIQGTLRGLMEHVHSELARKAPLTRHEALVKIQCMWKLRRARKQLQALVQSVYTSFQDPATGETYYYNRKTNTTQWTKPRALGDHVELASAASAAAAAGSAAHKRVARTRTFSSREELEADAARRIQGMARTRAARAQLRRLISSVYEKIWDASSARFYYHNTRTKQVKWTKPRWVNDADLLTPRARQEHAAAEQMQVKLAHLRATVTDDQAATMLQRAYRRKKGFEALLTRCQQVYERIFDASQNAYYYHNTRTKETTWEKPAVLRNAKADVFTPRSRLAHALAAATRGGSSSAQRNGPRRAWTEEQAAVCLQGLFRSRQAKRALDARLAQAYRKVWDADSERFYFVELRTQAVTWEPPSLLLRSGIDVPEFDRLTLDSHEDARAHSHNAMTTRQKLALAIGALACAVAGTGHSAAHALVAPDEAPPSPPLDLDAVVCGVDEILLASDGAIDRRSVQLGARVTPNHTLSGSVREDEYQFYHLCILRHEHEHQINVNLTLVAPKNGEDANLYLSSEEPHPRMGHSTWIAQRPGSDFLKLYTYLDGFPRKADAHSRTTLALHIGVRGVSETARYNLTVSVLDLPETQDIASRERFYAAQRARDRERWRGGADDASRGRPFGDSKSEQQQQQKQRRRLLRLGGGGASTGVS